MSQHPNSSVFPATKPCINLNDLPKLPIKQLREYWGELKIRGDPPKFKQGLVRGIALHIQQKQYGGMDAETRRLLNTAIRNAPEPKTTGSNKTRRKRSSAPKLKSGTKLVRRWRGRDYEVKVFNDGKRFLYLDREYKSLSEIAREITGTRWSGPRFFGLKKLKGDV